MPELAEKRPWRRGPADGGCAFENPKEVRGQGRAGAGPSPGIHETA